jgi:hypothetical protein
MFPSSFKKWLIEKNDQGHRPADPTDGPIRFHLSITPTLHFFFIRLRQDTLQLAAERNGEATAP